MKDNNKIKIVKEGGLKPLFSLLSKGNSEGQKIVSDLLWNLSWNGFSIKFFITYNIN